MTRLIVAVMCLLAGNIAIQAQIAASVEAQVENIMIGKPFPVDLEVIHPPDMVIILPDTGADFAPYELAGRNPIPTRSDENQAIDRVTYEVRSWSIDSLQELSFEVKYIQGEDTLSLRSTTDTVELIPAITTLADSLDFEPVVDLAPVSDPVNWKVWGIVLGVLALLLIGLVVILIKPIRRYFQRRRLEADYQKATRELDAARAAWPDQSDYLLGVARTWKNYLDKRVRLGLPSLSTRELAEQLPELKNIPADVRNELLALNRDADASTYGGQSMDETRSKKYGETVAQVLLHEFERRKEALKA